MLNSIDIVCITAGYFSLISLILVILAPSPVHMVIFGVTFYFFFGWTLIFLGYDIIGILLIMVYAGALMVMFLFVIMAFDLAHNALALSSSIFSVPSTLWSRVVILLFLFSCFIFILRYFDYGIVGESFYSFFIKSHQLYHYGSVYDGAALSSSVLEDTSLFFYNGFSVLLLLCGVALLVSLVGAVSLTGWLPFFFLKRRKKDSDIGATAARRRIVVLRRSSS